MVCEMGGNRNEFVNRNRQKKKRKKFTKKQSELKMFKKRTKEKMRQK